MTVRSMNGEVLHHTATQSVEDDAGQQSDVNAARLTETAVEVPWSIGAAVEGQAPVPGWLETHSSLVSIQDPDGSALAHLKHSQLAAGLRKLGLGSKTAIAGIVAESSVGLPVGAETGLQDGLARVGRVEVFGEEPATQLQSPTVPTLQSISKARQVMVGPARFSPARASPSHNEGHQASAQTPFGAIGTKHPSGAPSDQTQALRTLIERLQAADAKWENQTADLASLPALLSSCHPRHTRAHLLDSALAVLSLTQSPRSQVARAALSTLEVLVKAHCSKLDRLLETMLPVLLPLAFPVGRAGFLAAAARAVLSAAAQAAQAAPMMNALLSALAGAKVAAARAYLARLCCELQRRHGSALAHDTLLLQRTAQAALQLQRDAHSEQRAAGKAMLQGVYQAVGDQAGFMAMLKQWGVGGHEVGVLLQ
ncbi:hypothetical protein ACKKBG_A05380 [Auxenochlorella protothecoides x Auxenochlorella symbiontica]